MSRQDRNELYHYGVKGMKWGVRRYQNYDGSYTAEGKRRAVFVSGSSKTQTKDSGYYRKKLPRPIRKTLKGYMKNNIRINVGDAPGIDRQVQDYLNKKHYKNVEVYGPGTQVRYSANKEWKTNPIDAPEFEPGSKEWLAKKDIAMERDSTEGLAVVLDEGAKATRKNVERMLANNKDVKVYQLNKNGKDNWAGETEKSGGFSLVRAQHIAKNVAIGAAVVGGTALAAYGTYKLSELHYKKIEKDINRHYDLALEARRKRDIPVKDREYSLAYAGEKRIGKTLYARVQRAKRKFNKAKREYMQKKKENEIRYGYNYRRKMAEKRFERAKRKWNRMGGHL